MSNIFPFRLQFECLPVTRQSRTPITRLLVGIAQGLMCIGKIRILIHDQLEQGYGIIYESTGQQFISEPIQLNRPDIELRPAKLSEFAVFADHSRGATVTEYLE